MKKFLTIFALWFGVVSVSFAVDMYTAVSMMTGIPLSYGVVVSLVDCNTYVFAMWAQYAQDPSMMPGFQIWCSPVDGMGYPIITTPPAGSDSPPASSPAYGNSPFIIPPPINPIADNLVGAAAAVGLGLLSGIGLLVGAPVVAAVSGAAALVAGVMTAAGIAMNSPSTANAQTFVDAAKAPLSVSLTPSASALPAPVEGATTSPSVATDPVTGKFVPGGGKLSNGVSDGWSAGATGEWSYTPPATVSNPAPSPSVAISDSGYGLIQQTAPVSGGTSSSGIYVQRYSDGSVVVTNSATVPVTTAAGVPTTVDASVSTAFGTDGTLKAGGSSAAVAPVLGNGSDSLAGAGLSVSGFGGGTTNNIGTGASGPAGGCASGDCSTESTQLANKALLGDIKNALTGGDPLGDPQAKTGAELSGALTSAYGGSFNGLIGWQMPAHTSQCPSGTFTIPNSDHVFSFDGHCQFAAQNLPLLSSVFLVLWNLSALMIVIRL